MQIKKYTLWWPHGDGKNDGDDDDDICGGCIYNTLDRLGPFQILLKILQNVSNRITA